VTLVQARHLQIDASSLSYSSRRPVDKNIKLRRRKKEVGKQETSRYRWTCGHVSQVRIKPSHRILEVGIMGFKCPAQIVID
jgi:hypothetical protein